MNIDVGTVIAGRYELVRLIGKGAMGEVWLARHDSLGGEFAVKLVETTDDIEAETAAGRFQLEAQIAAKLSRRTRHIVSVSDHGEENGIAYLVMEPLEGESLESRVKRGGRMDLPEIAAVVMQVARALSLAHDEGIFHRDLKPANIFLTRDEDGRLLVKLLDFGIARAVKPFKTRSPFATSKDMVLGTPSYMSPEQARGLDSLDHRCDLWALATCAYEALAGRIPFEGETVEDIFLSICTFRVVPLESLRPDLGADVVGFFAKAFAPKLDERFATAQELSAAFETLVDPAALEPWLGAPGLTPSSRRMPVAPVSAPNTSPDAPTKTAKMDKPRLALVESGGIQPAAIDTFAGAGVPKRTSGLVIGGGALAAIAVVALVVLAFRSSSTPAASAAPIEPPPSATIAERSAVPPPPSPEPPPVAEPPAPAKTTTTAATAKPVVTPVAKAPKTPKPEAESTRHATAPPAPSPSPSPSPSPTTPAKKGPHDKGEVF